MADGIDYKGKQYPEMPSEYCGVDGARRYREDTYMRSECDDVIDRAIEQARRRLDAGDSPGAVRDWLADQVQQAAEDEAERGRFGRTAKLTLSDNPRETRSACAMSLARVVILDWQRRR